MEHTITILRYQFSMHYTKSLVHVDGHFFCYCLEPEVLKGTPIVGRRDAIPCGKYPVTYSLSPHMRKYTLELQNVPYNMGIRIHIGNISKDTDGCLIFGRSSGIDCVLDSTPAVESIENSVRQWLAKGDKVFCEVQELSYEDQLNIRP